MQSGLAGQDGSSGVSLWPQSKLGTPAGTAQPGGQAVQLAVNATSAALGASLSEALEDFFV
jgi:hypothetical protein